MPSPRTSQGPDEPIAAISKSAVSEHNRGLALAQAGRHTEAIDCFRRAIHSQPDFFAAHANLGTLLADQGRAEEARAALQMAVSVNPDNSAVHNNLANLLTSLGQLDLAVDHCRRSLAIAAGNVQGHAPALNALGNALKDQGLIDDAIAAYAQAALLRPDLPQPASNLLYAMHFQEGQTPAGLLKAHRDWARRHAPPLPSPALIYPNLTHPDRRLKIGYVSADFREHPVGRFILPLLQQHDRDRFQIFCYANQPAGDAMSDRIRTHADTWRDIAPLSDAQAFEMIRSDGIDILVDLTMHLRANRLLVFAQKPAPVQMTYLAYCSTTGLNAIDYRLTDPYLDPPGSYEQYVERSIRLPQTYWCYQANDAAPEVGPLPALDGGRITFSCLNNFCKVTSSTLAAWRRLLKALPQARLILHAGEGSLRQRARQTMDVEEDRLIFANRTPMRQYFERYHQIDIALDPFPCSGGTTSCDAMWMGVPLVTLAGETAVSRSGLSILSNIGHPEWIATTIDQYERIAINLANDRSRLSAVRRGLRDEMRHSPLMDAPTFARGVESAYRQMWHAWCRSSSLVR
jgi:protein O-GlcNAc transferase